MGQSRGMYTFFSHLRWTPAIALGYAQEISHLLKALVYGRLRGDYAGQRDLATKALVYDPTYDYGYLVRAEAGYALHAVLTLSQILDHWEQTGEVAGEQITAVRRFLEEPKAG